MTELSDYHEGWTGIVEAIDNETYGEGGTLKLTASTLAQRSKIRAAQEEAEQAGLLWNTAVDFAFALLAATGHETAQEEDWVNLRRTAAAGLALLAT